MASNYTGRVIYQNLEEYDTTTGVATGNIKPNIESDPDYIPPSINEDLCPIGSISVSPDSLYYPYNGGTKYVTVTATHPWSAIGIFANINPNSGGAGDTSVALTMLTTAEGAAQEHETFFNLDNGSARATLLIYQEANTGGGFEIAPR